MIRQGFEAQRVYSDASPFPRQQIEIEIAHYISITSKKQVRRAVALRKTGPGP